FDVVVPNDSLLSTAPPTPELHTRSLHDALPIYQLVTVAELADPIAGELAGEEAGHIGGTQAQGPGAFLIDVQVDYLARLLPVQMDMVDRRVAPYLGGDLPGHTAHLIDMLAGDTELDRIA